jgi:malonyl-CoA O-methyltransferase
VTKHKSRIAARFGAAAVDYDAHSPFQREAALRLAQQVKRLVLPAHPRVLEIGCGTGHLTRELLPALGGAWFASDVAPAMLAECRQRLGHQAHYIAMDGERPAFADSSFDLIVSSLTAQWFADLRRTLAALAALLAPGGRIALATLGADTLAEWREAHTALGLRAATPVYPDAAALARAFPTTLRTRVSEERIAEPIGNPLDFVRGWRAIGADTPKPGVAPLTAGQLRKVLHALAAVAPDGMTYHLLYAVAERPAA